MTRAEIEMLRSGYEAANRGDWDAAFRDLHSDFEWKTDDRMLNAGTYRGRAEVLRFLEDQREAFDEVLSVPEEFFEQGNRIVAFVRMRSRPKGTTRFSESHIAHVWTFRDGKASRCEAFAVREQALEAVGLTKDVHKELPS
jgi:ketosteroid isomerase-like protein